LLHLCKIIEALRMEIEVQRRLSDQAEFVAEKVQRIHMDMADLLGEIEHTKLSLQIGTDPLPTVSVCLYKIRPLHPTDVSGFLRYTHRQHPAASKGFHIEDCHLGVLLLIRTIKRGRVCRHEMRNEDMSTITTPSWTFSREA
ncbi:hypothetical protein MKW98_013870, partial [Papaver atlanticum]